MINLLSIEAQRQHRAARLNLQLRTYVVGLLVTLLLVLGMFGGGLFLTMRERAAFESELASHRAETTSYQNVRNQATAFAANLKIAKTILSQEILYSDLITRIASTLPSSAVLTALALGGDTVTTTQQLTLNARVKTKEDAIVLKNTLEASPLFENVNLNTITQDPPSNGTQDNRIVRDFPVVVTISVTQSKQTGVTTP